MPARSALAMTAAFGLSVPSSAAEPVPIPEPKPVAAPVAPPAPLPAPVPCPEPTTYTMPCRPACGPDGQAWVSAEWLYWAASGGVLPPLAAAPPGTPQPVAGTVGGPGTTVLLGGGRANNDFRNGLRVRAGTWLDDGHQTGVEADFFFLGRSRDGGTFGAADGSRIVTRPFTDAVTGLPSAELVSFPGQLAGTVNVRSTSEVIGGGVNYLCNHECGPCGRLDWLLGFRYLNLRDDLAVTENLTALSAARVPAGTGIVVRDRFRTDNDFYGVNVGAAYERWAGDWYWAARAAVAFGVTHRRITVDGSTTFTQPGGTPQLFPGGLLAQTTNIGARSGDDFAVLPEVGLRVGRQLTDRVRAFAGYTLVYWSSVARAGDQIDPTVNPNLLAPARLPLVGPARPAPRTVTTDYWLQGVSVGAEVRF